MQFIDTHIHLQDDKSNNATDIISRAQAEGCQKMICVCAAEDDWSKVAVLTERFPDMIIPAFGLHPWYVRDIKEGWPERLKERLEQFPEALIGECGLDGLKPEPEKQQRIFAAHIALAKEMKRPLIVHAVKAVPLMESFWPQLTEKTVFHAVNGKAAFIERIIRHGCYAGIGAGLLRHPRAAELLRLIPREKMLFETDAPSSAAGSWEISTYIRSAADLLDEEPEVLARQVYNNSLEFIR